MRKFFSSFPRAYRLKPVGQREEDALSLLTIGAINRNVLVPYSPGLAYVIASNRSTLPIKSSDFHVERLGALPSLRRGCVWRSCSRKNIWNTRSFSSFSVGPKAERKRFTRYNQGMMNIGLVADSDLAAKHPELIYEVARGTQPGGLNWPDRPRLDPEWRWSPISTTEDTWPDIAGALLGPDEFPSI